MIKSLEANWLASQAMNAMIDRYTERVIEVGSVHGLAVLREAVAGRGGNIEAGHAAVEALHLWAFMLRVGPETLVDMIESKVRMIENSATPER